MICPKAKSPRNRHDATDCDLTCGLFFYLSGPLQRQRYYGVTATMHRTPLWQMLLGRKPPKGRTGGVLAVALVSCNGLYPRAMSMAAGELAELPIGKLAGGGREALFSAHDAKRNRAACRPASPRLAYHAPPNC